MRRASNVKSADVKIGTVYAIESAQEPKVLKRFYVKYLTTRRKGNAPAEVDVTVTGYVLTEDRVQDIKDEITIPKSRLLGEYTAYEELVAQKRAEDEAYQAKKAAAEALRLRGYALLAKLTGIAFDPSKYSTSIDIDAKDIPAFVKWLESLS